MRQPRPKTAGAVSICLRSGRRRQEPMLFAYIFVSIIIAASAVLSILTVLTIRSSTREQRTESSQLRSELISMLQSNQLGSIESISKIASITQESLNEVSRKTEQLSERTENQLKYVREQVEQKLELIRNDNSTKLEHIRATVDEKLHATLEERLGQSFKLVSEQLTVVNKSLGEMQTLADGVGDLKRVLGNVKTRGILGEFQLHAILEDILAPDQYVTNVAVKQGSSDRVEFAVRLPGKGDKDSKVFLPIDAKFPKEDYERLLDAQKEGNLDLSETARKAIRIRIKSEAKDIADKYIDVPHTTDFAILFLPFEGLYAEVLNMPGIVDELQRNHHVVLAGPTTLAALLNSLQTGFKTLAIQQRSSEVWKVLGAVKTEFGKFGELLEKTKKRLDQASGDLDLATKKSTTIRRRLTSVEELPVSDAQNMLKMDWNNASDSEDSEEQEESR